MVNDDTHVIKTLLAQRADHQATAKPQGIIKYMGRVLAAYHGRRMLGASPFLRTMADLDGLTALGAAAMSGKAATVLALLEAGASPDQENWRGLTPRTLAEREGFPDMFDDVMTVADSRSEARGSLQALDF